MAPLDGCRQIYGVYRDLGYTDDMRPWLYLDDGLEPETYEELEGEKLEPRHPSGSVEVFADSETIEKHRPCQA